MGYAEITDIENAPANAQELIDKATDLIDYMTLGKAQYSLSDATNEQSFFSSRSWGLEFTYGQIREALKKACVAQVEHWINLGEDIDDFNGVASFSMGSFSMAFSGGQMSPIAPPTYRTLRQYGLLNRGVRTT